MDQLKYFVAFNQFHERIGPARIKKLLNYFGDLENAWRAGQEELERAGLESEVVKEFCAGRLTINPEKEIEKLEKEKLGAITILDENYPKLLKEIYDPPTLIYIKGNLKSEDEKALAIVGARNLSPYGQQATTFLSGQIAQAGLTIVSGLARGVDTLAHMSALQNNGRTIAVIGSGLDTNSIYPPSNRKLAEQVAERGAIISEYPLGAPALKHHFPARNRIISGLSLGTLVVEAAEKSGALLTAQHALEQNREVFAVPGSIFSQLSTGANNLIKSGAKLAANGQDVLDELNLKNLTSQIQARLIIPENEEEAIILKLLGDEPVHIDKIVNEVKMDTAKVNATIAMMEMKGKVRNIGGMNYVIAR